METYFFFNGTVGISRRAFQDELSSQNLKITFQLYYHKSFSEHFTKNSKYFLQLRINTKYLNFYSQIIAQIKTLHTNKYGDIKRKRIAASH